MIAAIVQARMGSTRLPGKVMKKALGQTLLEHLVKRLKKARTLQRIVVATTTARRDTPLARHAENLGVSVFRGSEEDVLDRYWRAAGAFGVDTVVRITADCPLLDPAVVDKVVSAYMRSAGRYDYVSNVEPQTFPIGMAVEVFSFAALSRAWRDAQEPAEREHVTLFIRNRTRRFRQGNVESARDYSHIRITVDTPEDLRVVRRMLGRFASERRRGTLKEIVALWEREPKLRALNAHVSTVLQKRRTESRQT